MAELHQVQVRRARFRRTSWRTSMVQERVRTFGRLNQRSTFQRYHMDAYITTSMHVICDAIDSLLPLALTLRLSHIPAPDHSYCRSNERHHRATIWATKDRLLTDLPKLRRRHQVLSRGFLEFELGNSSRQYKQRKSQIRQEGWQFRTPSLSIERSRPYT